MKEIDKNLAAGAKLQTMVDAFFPGIPTQQYFKYEGAAEIKASFASLCSGLLAKSKSGNDEGQSRIEFGTLAQGHDESIADYVERGRRIYKALEGEFPATVLRKVIDGVSDGMTKKRCNMEIGKREAASLPLHFDAIAVCLYQGSAAESGRQQQREKPLSKEDFQHKLQLESIESVGRSIKSAIICGFGGANIFKPCYP